MVMGKVEFESFIWVFLFGVGIFLALAFILGGPLGSSNFSKQSGGWFSDFKNDNSFDGLVYLQKLSFSSDSKVNSKYYYYGNYELGDVYFTRKLSEDELIFVQNGIFKNVKKEFNFELGDKTKVVLKFRIVDMNDYGNLKIMVNDELIYNDLGKVGKTYEIEINELREDNVLKIFADSSGAKFWAPTTYVLKDVVLTTDEISNVDNSFEFNLDNMQYSGFEKAVVRFQADYSGVVNDLNINLNGNNVYLDMPDLDVVNVFEIKDRNILGVGRNVLDVFALNSDMYSIKNMDVEVFYRDVSKKDVKNVVFDISDKKIKELSDKNIYLSFDLSTSVNDLFDIKLNGEKLDVNLNKGNNKIFLSLSDLVVGKNELSFTSFDSVDLVRVIVSY
jgi:hypothetical protein